MIFETDLKRRPKETANPKGRLPDGSIVTIVGKQRGDFQLVEVVLEDGTALEGWVNMNALERADRGAEPRGAPRPREEPGDRIVVPKDEGLLLRRKPSFYFGVNLGAQYSIIQPAQVTTENTYLGIGLIGGAYGGIYLQDNIPLRLEVSYVLFNGTDPNDVDTTTGQLNGLSYGFVDISVVAGLFVGDFELFGGVGYALGVSIASDPQNFAPNPGEEVEVPSDLSSLSGQLGAGYTFSLTREIIAAVKARYTIHFKTSPILFMGFGLLASFQLQG